MTPLIMQIHVVLSVNHVSLYGLSAIGLIVPQRYSDRKHHKDTNRHTIKFLKCQNVWLALMLIMNENSLYWKKTISEFIVFDIFYSRCKLPLSCSLSKSKVCLALPSCEEHVTFLQTVTLTSDLSGVSSEQEWDQVDQTLQCILQVEDQPSAVLGASRDTIYIW